MEWILNYPAPVPPKPESVTLTLSAQEVACLQELARLSCRALYPADYAERLQKGTTAERHSSAWWHWQFTQLRDSLYGHPSDKSGIV